MTGEERMTTSARARDADIYDLTDDQREWRSTLRAFADQEIAPKAARLD